MKIFEMSNLPARRPTATRGLGYRWIAALVMALGCGGSDGPAPSPALDPELVASGREIFRYDSFGDEQQWTDALGLHRVVEQGVSPRTALAVGLKVDAEALPPGLLESADLDDPATTVALLELDAVVGLVGRVETDGATKRLVSLGVTCAACHSTVDDSVAPGIGRRLDGWPNRDLDPGAILALSPAMQAPEVQAVLTSWGPGRYDAYWNLDGRNDPAIIPPAYGLAGVDLETFTGEGPVSYWNAYVAVTQMGAQGSFSDPRLGLDIEADPDLLTPKLAALRAYQLSLMPPAPPPGSFDAAGAERGEELFRGRARCATCHSGALFTDANERLHDPAEVGTDATLAERSTTGRYRTTPLRGVWHRAPYFHDGSAATLEEVVRHYDRHLELDLRDGEVADLVAYLRSL